MVAFVVYIRDKRNKVLKIVVNEAIAFYYSEKAAIDEIVKLTGDNDKTVQRRIRNAGKIHPDNTENVRPSKAPRELKSFLRSI